jgi:hypothetical protein
MKKNLLILTLITCTFFSCKKSDSTPANTDCQLTAANIAGSYKVTALTYKTSASAAPLDIYTLSLQQCQRDDIYVLNTNGTVNYNDVGTVCSPSGTTTGTWALSGSQLTIDGQSFTVTSYTCTTITGTAANVNTPGDELTSTFTRQ